VINNELQQTECLRLSGIKKQYDNVEILRGLDLSVGRGEFVTLLGPSGCGKTTTLRIIAGLETADAGQIFIDGQDITSFDPDKRGINMVFQNYALFPHMNVEDNIGYSLKLKGKPKNEIQKEVAHALALIRLPGFEKRKPEDLSGGERQRVAVARALINRPKVLLLDEPLGALDLNLRRKMQIELKRLQKQLGITFVYITHDQEEAITMSDRIAVMRDGVFDQVGSPSEIYNNPKTGFTAKFVGGANVLRGKILSVNEFSDNAGKKIRLIFEHPAGCNKIELDENDKALDIQKGTEIIIAVREENITFVQQNTHAAEFQHGNGLTATITGKNFSGGLLRISARLHSPAEEEIFSSCQGVDTPLEIGDKIIAKWDAAGAVLLENE
jgi:spermidine/putrescine transport system ATP-binding protein